jgi:uncharacterized membrane protein HdeD (DUF308 family)
MNAESGLGQSGASKFWWLGLLTGLLFVAVGLWVLRSPMEGYVALALIFALSFFANGLAEIIVAVTNRANSNWGWLLVGGMVDLLFGIFLMRRPMLTMTILPFIVGFGLLFRSMLATGASFELKHRGVSSWGWVLVLGIAGLLLSFVMLMNPAVAGMTIVVWTAMAFIATGLSRMALAFNSRG